MPESAIIAAASLLLALFVNFIVGSIQVGQAKARLDEHARRLEELARRLTEQDRAIAEQGGRVTALLVELRERTARIEAAVEALANRNPTRPRQ